MAFPIIGEKKISLSLNPKETSKEIAHSKVLQMLEVKMGDRYNKSQILDAMEEFFVLTSEFVSLRSKAIYPTSYLTHIKDEHFIMEKRHGQFRFVIDSYVLEQGFFRRVIIQIYPQIPAESSALFTLFLVPKTCDG